MISMFGWPDTNMGLNQSEHILYSIYTCYFIIKIATKHISMSDVHKSVTIFFKHWHSWNG